MMFFIQVGDNGVLLSSDMLAGIDPVGHELKKSILQAENSTVFYFSYHNQFY